MINVRPYTPADQLFVLGLAPRLVIGMPPWRDPQQWLLAVQGWISNSINPENQKTVVFVAEDEQRERLGFATVTRASHFTGEPQAYIGELATTEAAEGHGVGKTLLQACEKWALGQGYRVITLATGAANARALGFYHHLGYQDEDVTLVKLLM
jgi:GNAT superfamily N-acetyltransferase